MSIEFLRNFQLFYKMLLIASFCIPFPQRNINILLFHLVFYSLNFFWMTYVFSIRKYPWYIKLPPLQYITVSSNKKKAEQLKTLTCLPEIVKHSVTVFKKYFIHTVVYHLLPHSLLNINLANKLLGFEQFLLVFHKCKPTGQRVVSSYYE